MLFASDLPVTASAAQIRAARALLGWKQEDLAREAAVARRTLATLEGGGDVTPVVTAKLQSTLEAAGIRFIRAGNGSGLLLLDADQVVRDRIPTL